MKEGRMTADEMKKIEINRRAANLQTVLRALHEDYAKCAREGQLEHWAKAAHAVIDYWARPAVLLGSSNQATDG